MPCWPPWSFTLKQLRLSLRNETHTKPYTGPRPHAMYLSIVLSVKNPANQIDLTSTLTMFLSFLIILHQTAD